MYRDQGVSIHDKHIELIVRQMTRRVAVPEPGDSDFLPGERVDRRSYADVNRRARQEGKTPAEGRPELMGITKASLATDSWLSAASFQETTRVLTEAAIESQVRLAARPQGEHHHRQAHPGRDGHAGVPRHRHATPPTTSRWPYYSSDADEPDPAEWLASIGGDGDGAEASADGPTADGRRDRRRRGRPTASSAQHERPVPRGRLPAERPAEPASAACTGFARSMVTRPATVVARAARPRSSREVRSCPPSSSWSARAASPSRRRRKTPALKGAPQRRGVCTRVYTTTPEEAELGAAQGRPCAAHQRHRGHRLHPGRGPQPAGALDRARPRRPGEGPPGVRYKIIRGTLDTSGVRDRKQARSRYGAKKEG